MPITSHYPDQGFRIPYEKYLDNAEIINKILFVPENNNSFKYATKHVSDDETLSIVERFLEIVNYLIEIGDKTENWGTRKQWLLDLLGELWKNRGAYPGLPSVLNYLSFNEGIKYYKDQTSKGKDKEAYQNLKRLVNGDIASIKGLNISENDQIILARTRKLRDKDEQDLLLDILPRFDLSPEQVSKIISIDRKQNCLYCELNEIYENPYLLSEQYLGDNWDDYITFNKIDHGILPSPDLGIDNIFEKDSAERFRALCVEELKKETNHSFVLSNFILSNLNERLSYLPEWKSFKFNPKNFEVDEDVLEQAITIKQQEDKKYLYLQNIYDDERLIEKQINSLIQMSAGT